MVGTVKKDVRQIRVGLWLDEGRSPINRFTEKISDWQSRRPFITAIGVSCVCLLALVFAHGYGHVGAIRILYLLPIWLAVRLDGKRGGLTMVALTVGSMFGEDLFEQIHPTLEAALTELAFRALSFTGIAWIIAGVETRLARTENLALHDPLTGVFNRRALHEFWQTQVVEKGSQNSYVVVMIDCDGFKHVNDQFGHEAGDRVLQMLGKVLESETRKTDLVARVGGDEFVIVLKETVPAEARKILQRVESIFETRVLDSGYACSLSVGYAPIESVDVSIDDILRKADRAMYEQKEFKKATAFLN